MKLHSLEIHAFGPFSDKESIDFLALGKNALFLIDGPTGAGKSSILHAICYALYGETTDSERKELGLRCDHANPELLTHLSLVFSIKQESYRITRIPAQMRPTKRGTGETEQKSSAHLTHILSDGSEETLVAKKKTDADLKIKEIVGLTAQQFLQVMVLPQGKFRELLLAKSDQRQAILSTLFQTEIYQRIEQLLKDKAGNIDKQYQAFEKRKQQALSDVGVTTYESLEQAIHVATENVVRATNDKDKVAQQKQVASNLLATAKALDKQFSSQQDKQKELAEQLQQTESINIKKAHIQQIENALSIAPQWQILQVIVKEIRDKKIAITKAHDNEIKINLQVADADNSLKKSHQAYQQRDVLKAKESELKGFEKQLTLYESLIETSNRANKNYALSINEKDALIKKNQTIELSLENLTEQIELLTEEISDQPTVIENKLIAEGYFNQRQQLETARDEYIKLKDTYDKENRAFEKAENRYKQAEKVADQLEMRWFSNQAAVLATKLEAQQPCAVCGSLEHPNPAVFSADASGINQQAVDKARELESKQFKLMDSAKTIQADTLYIVQTKNESMQLLEIGLGHYAKQTVAEVELPYKALTKRLIVLENKQKQLAKDKIIQRKKRLEREPLLSEIKAIETHISKLIAEKARANNTLETASKALPETFRKKAQIEQALLDIVHKIKRIEKNQQVAENEKTQALSAHSALKATLQTLNQNLTELEQRHQHQSQDWQSLLLNSAFSGQEAFQAAYIEANRVSYLQTEVKKHETILDNLNAQLALLKEQLKQQQRPDLESLQQQIQTLSTAFIATESHWKTNYQQQQQLLDTQKKITRIESEQTEIKKDYEVMGLLSKVASGKGRFRVSLERFVLGNLLDSVLSIASQRLHRMSQGQYRLIRQNEAEQKRNATAGLDLAIDDAYTGKTRPVATLSGGESFMASLALALGLSDIVQERSGGIQLDTLFIDEGFGSLDQESLQLAINTLTELQSTGRTIGIISHVAELKEQMAQRIEVTRSQTGSTIKRIGQQ